MYSVTIHGLTCFLTEDVGEDEYKLQVWADDDYHKHRGDINEVGTKNIGATYHFENRLKVKLWDEDPGSDNHLGTHEIQATDIIGPMVLGFSKEGSTPISGYDYLLTLTFEKDGAPAEDAHTWSMRDNLSMMGKGVMEDLEYDTLISDFRLVSVSNEQISFKKNFLAHRAQDGNKSETDSMRRWIQTHCDFHSPFGARRSRPGPTSLGRAAIGYTWDAVDNEYSRRLAGFINASFLTHVDLLANHETFDWNWNMIPDPAFCYMWGAGGKTLRAPGTGGDPRDHGFAPVIHNEWESGSMPLEFRPTPGQYNISIGRHIWDTGHAPVKAEVHPGHTMINYTSRAASLGSKGELVPVNQAVVGMASSGGFTALGSTNDRRWEDEHGHTPTDRLGDAEDVYYTALKKHPVTFQLYPPVPRPSETANLVFYIRRCEHITIPDKDQELIDFLNKLQGNNPEDPERNAHRLWSDLNGHAPVETPPEFCPQPRLRTDLKGKPTHFDVVIRPQDMPNLPVGYLAVVECGWNEPSPDVSISRFRLKFVRMEVHVSAGEGDGAAEWSYFFGVNGQQRAHWFGHNQVVGRTEVPEHKKTFNVDVITGQPMIIHENGIDRDPTGDWVVSANIIDQIKLVIPPGDIMQQVIVHPDTTVQNTVRDHRPGRSFTRVDFSVQGSTRKGERIRHTSFYTLETLD